MLPHSPTKPTLAREPNVSRVSKLQEPTASGCLLGLETLKSPCHLEIEVALLLCAEPRCGSLGAQWHQPEPELRVQIAQWPALEQLAMDLVPSQGLGIRIAGGCFGAGRLPGTLAATLRETHNRRSARQAPTSCCRLPSPTPIRPSQAGS